MGFILNGRNEIKDFSQNLSVLSRNIEKLYLKFPAIIKKAQDQGVVFGFDGFLDEIMAVIKKRFTTTTYDLMTSMKEWAEIIKNTAGSSTGMETILKDRRTGGFVSNTSQALASVLVPKSNITLFGNFGSPQIMPIFNKVFSIELGCKLVTIGEPGTTNAFEFDDGKVMMTNFTPIHKISTQAISKVRSNKDFIQLLNHSKLFGFGYWSTAPEMSNIYDYFHKNIISKLSNKIEMFFDLADIRKRTNDDIQRASQLICQFSENASVTLSLNDKEAKYLALVLNKSVELETPEENETLQESIQYFLKIINILNNALSIKRIVIHTPKFAMMNLKNENDAINQIIIVPNAYTSHPKFTVAAGDTFNGGLILGIISRCTPFELLMLGNVLTSFFIRTGKRGNSDQIAEFIKKYLSHMKDS
jgi:ketohexokinase